MHKILFFVLLVIAVAPVFVSAQDAINLNLDYPEFGNITLDKDECDKIKAGNSDKTCGQNLNIVAWVYYLILGISGLAAFLMLVWGGIQWLTSGAIPSQAAEARDKLKSAVLGLLLILASFLIIQVLNPELTVIQQEGLDEFLGRTPKLERTAKFLSPTVDGVYVCRDGACGCNGSCTEGSYSEGVDFHFYNPVTWGVVTTSSDPGGVRDLGSWGDKVAGLRIKGPYGVLLADDKEFKGDVICFELAGPNLGNVFHDGGSKPWRKDGAESLKILREGVCTQSRVTFPSIEAFWSAVAP